MTRSLRLPASFLAATACALALAAAARAADENTNSIKFSDPAKPGTLKIAIGHGDIRIKGEDTAEVSVKSEAKPITKKPRKDGLRVLTASATFSLVEKDNVVTIDAMSEGWGWGGGSSDFVVTVPRNTNIVIANSFGGDVTCAGVTGDVDIKNMSGEIRLEDITGGALVETMNGEIRAGIRELHDGKPLSFTSMNGEVVLRVPADAKANVRLRTQNGSILTDFDETALVTKTENTPRSSSSRRGPKGSVTVNGVLTPEARDAIREATRTAAQAIREAAQVARDAAQTARDAAREATRDADSDTPTPPTPPMAAMPKMPAMPPLPPMTGGKLVSGTLHGGGPEISVTTMNGDVTLRQIEAKK